MRKNKILIVDDEEDLCHIMQINLETSGYDADVAYSAEEALSKISGTSPSEKTNGELSLPYDLLLLDVMMPGMSGFELAAQLKSDSRYTMMPIIFLTAKDSLDDTLNGFSLGADDYVSKPFSVKEVLARVKAVISRSHQHTPARASTLSFHGLTMYHEQKKVEIDGVDAAFTRTEFELLWLLLNNRNVVFSRQQLIEKVWPKDVIVTGRTIDVNINRLRKKIGHYAPCIATRQGFGYFFKEDEWR